MLVLHVFSVSEFRSNRLKSERCVKHKNEINNRSVQWKICDVKCLHESYLVSEHIIATFQVADKDVLFLDVRTLFAIVGM